jgi:DNA-binding NarL/FixJ family response regulator
MSIIRIGMFDDHPIIMDGLSGFLHNFKNQIEVVFIAENRGELLKRINFHDVDLLVMDVVAPEVNGLDLFQEVLEKYPSLKIIAYTSLKSTILVENLLSIGVKGFVNKSQKSKDILDAILSVCEDQIVVPEKYKFLTSKFRENQSISLTKREIEIIVLISQEATTQQIAEKLLVSTKTIENHKNNIFNKLEVKNAAGLILAATRMGYIS